ncbi:MAG: glycosyltransferase family 4 protein [Candidatus Parcubacteria bacterium]|nr:glycosyltransferase family 4 protein [Candidatus Parcubacteria bacterium]
MRLIYIANARIPTEKAHGLQIMKMCEAFAQKGLKVELVIPWRFNRIKEDPFAYYDIKKNFKITKIPSLDLIKFGKIGFWIQSFSFAKIASGYAFFKKSDIIYSRDVLPLFFLSFFGKNIVWESHGAQNNPIIGRTIKKCDKVVAITKGVKDFYVQKYNIDEDKILVASDAVDLKEFDITISKKEARQKLNLPKNKRIILYSGSFYLYDWKGIDVLLGAAKYFDDKYLFVLVGGAEKEILEIKEKFNLKNILLIGHQPHSLIPIFLKAADVLVLPNKKGDANSEKYTSPMKLFEYMASGVPIVASDLPSIREILNKNNAVLVEPNNPAALTERIKNMLQNPELADKISKQAYLDVQNYTWEKRAEKILDFVNFSE